MKMLSALATVLIFTCYATGARADESTSQIIRQQAPAGITEALYQCIDKADSNMVATAACLTAEKNRQDKRLNANYKALLAKLTPESKKQLVLAERAWLKFKETNGAFENTIYGDEIISNLELTQNEVFSLGARADVLEKYLDIASDK